MVRRSLPVMATFLAVVLLLAVAAPVFAYGQVNPLHLRLSRLGPLRCGTPIGILATLTDNKGDPVGGVTVHFSIDQGRRGDRLSPGHVVTNTNGKAVTLVTLACTNDTHVTSIVATGPGNAKARITLVLHHHHHHYWARHDRDRHYGAAPSS